MIPDMRTGSHPGDSAVSNGWKPTHRPPLLVDDQSSGGGGDTGGGDSRTACFNPVVSSGDRIGGTSSPAACGTGANNNDTATSRAVTS